ncbi:MAG: flippase-like domain-containing protein [Caldisericia bacterium]|nr:flippase-like domain-containing protein [Caldisericia bacterium]
MRNFKKNLIIALILSLGVIIFIFIISFFKEGGEIFKVKLDFRFILISSLILISIWIFEVLRLKIIFNFQNIKLSFFYLLYTHLVSYFFSTITPMGIGGFAAKVYLISKKRNFEIGNIVSIFTFLYLFNMFIYLVFSFILLFFIKNFSLNFKFGTRLIFFFVIFIFLLSFLIFLIIIKPELFRRLSHKILNLFKKLNMEKRKRIEKIIDENYFRFIEGMRSIRYLKFKLIPIAILTFLSFIFLNSLSFFLINSLKVKISFYNSFLLQFIYHFFAGWSITPGGSGISEALYSALFVTQIGLSKILPLTILFKLFTFYIYILIGGILTFRELKSFLEINKIYEERRNY